MDKLIMQLSGAAVCLILLTIISAWAALAVMVAGAVVLGVVWIQLYRLHIRSLEAGIRQAETAASFQAVSSPHGVLSLHNGQLQFWTKQSANIPGQVPCDFDFIQAGRCPDLLPELTKIDRALIVAGMGSGKSELLKWIAKDAAENRGGDVFIIDSHASPDTWPISGVNVVGIGRDYGQIEATVNYICSEMDHRYKQRSDGSKKHFLPITLIIDELTVLHQFCDLQQQFKSLLCECRKVNIRLFFAGQSDRAGALGLTGNADLKAGFEAVVYLKKKNGAYLGDVYSGYSKQPETFIHPGVFQAGNVRHNEASCHSGMASNPHDMGYDRHYDTHDSYDGYDTMTGIPFNPDGGNYVWEPPEPRRFYESAEHRTMCEMFLSGESLNSICKAIFGSANGRRASKIKSVLEQYGIK